MSSVICFDLGEGDLTRDGAEGQKPRRKAYPRKFKYLHWGQLGNMYHSEWGKRAPRISRIDQRFSLSFPPEAYQLLTSRTGQSHFQTRVG